jgi:hypothetical protein
MRRVAGCMSTYHPSESAAEGLGRVGLGQAVSVDLEPKRGKGRERETLWKASRSRHEQQTISVEYIGANANQDKYGGDEEKQRNNGGWTEPL